MLAVDLETVHRICYCLRYEYVYVIKPTLLHGL